LPGPELTGVVPLARVTSVEQAGHKALTLARLARHGIRVPEAFVLPPDTGAFRADALLAALGGCVAVRSSATAEDLAGASFAGQFATVLGVRTGAELARAVRVCRASLRSPAVAAYCARHGFDPRVLRMAVLVQRMVQAEVAGVLFTVDPTSGREDEVRIEACRGLGAELVAGRASGTPVVVRGDALPARSAPLSAQQVRALVRLGRRVQALQGSPQDIEWAIEGDRLLLLQARPITRLGSAGIEGEWTTADFRDGGVASSVVAPLTWSLYAPVWDEALKGFLRDLRLLDGDFEAARLFYGRPYWNLGAVKRCAARLPGYVERELDRDVGVEPAYAGDGRRTAWRPWTVVRALPVLLAGGPLLRRQEARARRLLHAEPWTRVPADLPRLADAELVEQFRRLVREVHRSVEVEYFRTIFGVALARLALRSTLRASSSVALGPLIGGLDGLAHVACAQALWEVGNGTGAGLDAVLARHGHHSRRELDLRVPRWSEDHAFVAGLARQLAGTESPAETAHRQRRRAEEGLERTRQRLPPWRRGRFGRRLVRLRRYLWLREQMRDASLRTYAAIRAFALELGRRATAAGTLRTADDAFYLTATELATALEARCADLAERRRAAERMYRRFSPPREVGRPAADVSAPAPAGRLRGIGVSPGAYTGRACVVVSLDEAAKLRRGDVLVGPFVDPGWTPLLGVAGAVVAETGGLLSHAAVVCRELGLPAVLNAVDATRRLRDGQPVRVDGDVGHVDLLG
jgi:pyruvate,water dikinase